MPAAPRPGLRYRQEYLAGEAEDRAQVVSVAERVEILGAVRSRALMTRDLNPLTGQTELKLYVRGIGPVLGIGLVRGAAREQLVGFRPGR
jgi:hypothetical protein